jgi:lysophospholipase L1-like esterase
MWVRFLHGGPKYMLECLIVGDSIAVGVAQHRPQCELIARVGITSTAWNKRFAATMPAAQHTVISLGTNDWLADKTFKEIAELRDRISGRVTWILPANNTIKQTPVVKVAQMYGDVTLVITQTTKDGIHPTGGEYRRLAEQTKY